MKKFNNENSTDRNFEGKYRMLKKEFVNLNQRLNETTCMKFAFIILSSFLVVVCSLLFLRNIQLTEENKKLYADNIVYENNIEMYMDTALYFADMSVAMDDSNATLKEMYSNAQEELIAYKEREELYNRYEWALVYGNERNDITYGQIITLQEYCEEKGYSSEMVDLVLAIAMKESHGNEDAYNASSGATGYGQFLYGTGKFVYTKLQGNEKYNHDIALDGEQNLKMVADYIQYLYEHHNNSLPKAIDSYRGLHSESYINEINGYLDNNNLSIYITL